MSNVDGKMMKGFVKTHLKETDFPAIPVLRWTLFGATINVGCKNNKSEWMYDV